MYLCTCWIDQATTGGVPVLANIDLSATSLATEMWMVSAPSRTWYPVWFINRTTPSSSCSWPTSHDISLHVTATIWHSLSMRDKKIPPCTRTTDLRSAVALLTGVPAAAQFAQEPSLLGSLYVKSRVLLTCVPETIGYAFKRISATCHEFRSRSTCCCFGCSMLSDQYVVLWLRRNLADCNPQSCDLNPATSFCHHGPHATVPLLAGVRAQVRRVTGTCFV
jgi:hypothetical protein